jgi:hypothetical protein
VIDRPGIGPRLAGTSGGGAGTSGWFCGTRFGADFWIGWSAYAAMVILVTALEIGDELNILSGLKVAMPRWVAWTNGSSSVVALIVLSGH